MQNFLSLNLLTIANVTSLGLALVAVVAYWRLLGRSKALSADLDKVARELSQAQTSDPVTGALTLAKFDAILEEACHRSDASGRPLAVIYLDLDHFRSANDAFGRIVGDLVLKQVAQRITEVIGAAPPLARLTGDEFALLVDGQLVDAKRVAKTFLAQLSKPFSVTTQQVRLTCSVGIAMYPDQGSRRNILEKAATATRTVKLQGGDGFAEYSQEAVDARRESAKLLHDLRGAVERKEFELFYQPKIDAHSLQITAVEALIRWRHPQLGMVSPNSFIALAERYGVIQEIGRWVIEEACRQAQIWRGQGLRMRIAVNISGHQLRQDDFAEHLASVLSSTQTLPSRFTCEITESIAMEDTTSTILAFDRLGELGVHVSIDDFGTGHSSLASLKRLPAQELKIDRAFVTDLGTSEHAQFIAQAIVSMAHTLKLRVVAEGVENRKQRDMLVAMGCDELQGYLFAKPMPASELSMRATTDRSDMPALFRPSIYSDTVPAQLK